MPLPIRTTLVDVTTVCEYLMNKPTGATLSEARAVVAGKHLDGRKLTAFKSWGFVEDDNHKLKITERGRLYVRDSGSSRSNALRDVVRETKPYYALVERIVSRSEITITATEVAAHWHEHFRDESSELEKTLNDQALCFFHVAQGADLGVLKYGRKGQSTRFEFDLDIAKRLLNMPTASGEAVQIDNPTEEIDDEREALDSHDAPIQANGAVPQANESVLQANESVLQANESVPQANQAAPSNDRVFLTHGKNKKILGQIKKIVKYGKFEPVVAVEHETSAKPVPQKVMSDMRTCRSAIINVSTDNVLYDEEGNEVPQLNGNVLIEIGAAMALYSDKFILLVEEGLELPSNLQGLYECRYQGDELSGAATMKLLEGLNDF